MNSGPHSAEAPAGSGDGRGRRDGFTLVEVLVSVVILAVSIVAVIAAFNHSLHAFGETLDALKANRLIIEKMAGLQLQALQEGALSADESRGAFSEEGEGFEWECRVTALSTGGTGAEAASLNQVDVSVWREGAQRRYSASTLIRVVEER